MDYTVCGILQARILEWVNLSLLQGIFPTQVSRILGWFLTSWAPREAPYYARTRAKLLRFCLTLGDPMNCSPPGSSLSVGFSRQENCSGLPCPPPGDLPVQGPNPPPPPPHPHLLHLRCCWQEGSLPLAPLGRSSSYHGGLQNRAIMSECFHWDRCISLWNTQSASVFLTEHGRRNTWMFCTNRPLCKCEHTGINSKQKGKRKPAYLIQYFWNILFVTWWRCFLLIEERNGNPLQCSCLENPIDGGARWAMVHAVTKRWTKLSN